MSYYDINFQKVTQWLLPFNYREQRNLDFFKALLKPLTSLYNELILTYRSNLIKDINLRFQKQLLENYINIKIFGSNNFEIYFNEIKPFPIDNSFLFGFTNSESILLGFTNEQSIYQEFNSVTYNFEVFDYVMYYPSSLSQEKLNEAIKIVSRVAFVGEKIKTIAY